MGALHGLPQKIGQLLSLSELSQANQPYTALTEYEATLPASAALAEIQKHLGRPLDQCFRTIDEKGISASLGQVHRGVLSDGRPVAVKFQYPGIAEVIAHDLDALGWLTAPVGSLKRGFDLAAYQVEVGSMLQKELDYRQEARFIRRFSGYTADWDNVAVPTVIEELSNDRILTMTWLEGDPFSAARRWPLDEREELARCLLTLFLASCFRWGLLHADPHPGNYRFLRRSGKVIVGVLDFGCVKELSRSVVDALAGLVQDVIDDRVEKNENWVLDRYVELGFNREMLLPMAHVLGLLSQVLFEPFRHDNPFSLHTWNLGERTERILGTFRWNFRFAGPANLIFFLRAYQGLIQYLRALDAPINWRAIWEEIGRDHVLKPSPQSVPTPPEPSSGLTKSSLLRIRVTENNRTKVELTFGARAAEDLPDLIPPDLEAKLAQRSIDVHQITRKVVANEFAPAELFRLDEPNKCVRVWLE